MINPNSLISLYF